MSVLNEFKKSNPNKQTKIKYTPLHPLIYDWLAHDWWTDCLWSYHKHENLGVKTTLRDCVTTPIPIQYQCVSLSTGRFRKNTISRNTGFHTIFHILFRISSISVSDETYYSPIHKTNGKLAIMVSQGKCLRCFHQVKLTTHNSCKTKKLSEMISIQPSF